MNTIFYKYQGTGNDFVIIDNRSLSFPKKDVKFIARLCDRKFGIGADGLILLEDDVVTDFRMIYFNADGKEGSMCGNGGRCIVAFANFLELIQKETSFSAVDGLHSATIDNDIVRLKMQDVSEIRQKQNAIFMNTGSPHHVQQVNMLDTFDVVKEGAKLRYGLYGEKGSNINFVSKNEDGGFDVRTYERGVEDETLACGTGVTAVAIAMHFSGKTQQTLVPINVLGGALEISFKAYEGNYTDIYLKGPAKQVFKGEVSW